MDDQLPNPSKPTLYSGLTVLIGLTIICVVFFISMVKDISPQWGSESGVFVFNKGAFYLPGVVLGLSVLLYAIIRESVLRKKLTERAATYCTRAGVAAVVIMLALPNLVEYAIERQFDEMGYQICEDASHQWLHSKITAYARDSHSCSILAENGSK